jgi:hypothetical protein
MDVMVVALILQTHIFNTLPLWRSYKFLSRRHPHHDTSHTHIPRYVLDFYKGKIHPSSPAAIGMHLDVRPALDSPTAFMDRAYVFGMQVLYCCRLHASPTSLSLLLFVPRLWPTYPLRPDTHPTTHCPSPCRFYACALRIELLWRGSPAPSPHTPCGSSRHPHSSHYCFHYCCRL